MLERGTALVALVAFVVASAGCAGRRPEFLSEGRSSVPLEPNDIAIQGPTQGSSSVFVLFEIPFGAPSYHDAEQAALRANGSDVLLDRVRYAGFEGLSFPLVYLPLVVFPPLWPLAGALAASGFNPAWGQFVLVGNRTWYVEGTGAKYTK